MDTVCTAVSVPAAASNVYAVTEQPYKKRVSIEFSYVCPEPVLVKLSFYIFKNGAKDAFSYLLV
eukprot:COSAG06_NODE_43328_length_373_cov_0.627737_1_plen_63_part_10